MSGQPDPDGPEDRDEPLEGLAAEVARRRATRPGESPATSMGELGPVEGDVRFSEEPFEAVEALWESVDTDETVVGDRSGIDGGVGTAIVSKRSYCEQCEYFSEPPAARCTHEGTDIVEFVDRERVRVRRCPVVARRRAMGEIDRDR